MTDFIMIFVFIINTSYVIIFTIAIFLLLLLLLLVVVLAVVINYCIFSSLLVI